MIGVSQTDHGFLGSINLDYFGTLDENLEKWALLAESATSLELFARLASSNRMGLHELRSHLASQQPVALDPIWACRLAYVAALLPDGEDRFSFAEQLLSGATSLLVYDKTNYKYFKLLVELRTLLGDHIGAKNVIETTPLKNLYHGYLTTDMNNPFAGGDGSVDGWLKKFSMPFTDHQLTPIRLTESDLTPFDRLDTAGIEFIAGGPLVSIIQTVYNPGADELRTAAKSILRQTWLNLELLLIDDCSPHLSEGLLEDLAAADPRVRIIRLEQNLGTYRARNVGLLAARGEFVTGQDSDDWSHPERLARQMSVAVQSPHSAGVITRATRTDNNLTRFALGMAPDRQCEISFLFRRDDALAIGGYLPVRKAADSEFRVRMERWKGLPAKALNEPLYVIRASRGSLSRSDFRAGWSHQSRRAFWSAYTQWHERATREELTLGGLNSNGILPFPCPSRLNSGPPPEPVDVCILADWRVASRQQINSLSVLASHYRVGIIHVDSPVITPDTRRIHPEVQEFVNNGDVLRLYLDEDPSTTVLIIEEPSVLQFSLEAISTIRADRVLILLDEQTQGKTYDLDVIASASQLCGDVTWSVREYSDPKLLDGAPAAQICDTPFPIAVAVDEFKGRRLEHPSAPIVIGRLGSSVEADWPSAADFTHVYPLSGLAEVRVLGDVEPAMRLLNRTSIPQNWIVFDADQLDPAPFLRSLTCLVHFDRHESRGARLAMLEAMASGCVVITNHHYRAVFGSAVVGSDPGQAFATAGEFARDEARRSQQARLAQTLVLEKFGPQRLVEFIKDFIRKEWTADA